MPDVEYISAGFYFTAPIPRPDWAHGSRALLPDRIVTLSPCLATIVPTHWPSPAIPPVPLDLDALARMGIDSERAKEIEVLVSSECAADATRWPWRLPTLAAARAFGSRFVPRDGDSILVGVELPADCMDAFFEGSREARTVSERSKVLAERRSVEDSGELLGYEVLGDGLYAHHSIICTGGEVDLARDLGIVANNYGLLATLAEARRASDWASVDDHAKPFDYFPWRMTRHTW